MEQLTVEKFFCSVCGEEILNECFIVSGAFVTNSSAGNELKFADDVKLAHKECVESPSVAKVEEFDVTKSKEFKALKKENKEVVEASGKVTESYLVALEKIKELEALLEELTTTEEDGYDTTPDVVAEEDDLEDA